MKTLRLRLKDKHAELLREMACAVNFVWNYCNALSYEHTRRTGRFFSAYDLQDYTVGATKGADGLPLNAATIQMVGA